jgi:hypothetical protein
MVAILKYNFASQFPVVWSVTFTKISVACMLRRIQQSKTWTMSVVIFILAATAIIYTGLALTACNHITAYWDLVLDPRLALGCRDQTKAWTVTLACSRIHIAQVMLYTFLYIYSSCCYSDRLLLSLIPITFIIKIQVPLREKVVLCALMGLGILASIGSILKVSGGRSLTHSRDITWDSVTIVMWVFAEQYLGIIAANVPCLKALFEQLLRRLGVTLPTYTESQIRSYNTHTQKPTARNTPEQGSVDGTAVHLGENGVRSVGAWYQDGKGSHLACDSEGYLLSDLKAGVYAAESQELESQQRLG